MKKPITFLILFLFLNFQAQASGQVTTQAPSRASTKEAQTKKPTHLLFMVFDQMRPDYIERFNLKNFKRLKKMGTHFKNAYVGHMASVTVVSHAVMTTGLMPSDLPWSENTIWDIEGKLGTKNQTYNTTAMTQEQYLRLLSDIQSEQFLAKRFKSTTGKKVFTVGEKNYATIIMGGPYSDSIIYAEKKSGQCKPFGVNVPDYISKKNRYTIDCSSTFGTENSLYPLDGNHFYPGKDPEHLGGDIWVADVAIDLMNNEPDWGALFLTFGAIDRFAHMLGETDKNTPHAYDPPIHLKEIAQIADAQLGRLLDELKKKKLLESTLIVTTADHGGQTNEIFMGNPNGNDHIFWLQRISKMAPLKFSSSDTGLRLWLKEPNLENVQKTVSVLKEISQVTEVFTIDRSAAKPVYKSVYQNLDSQPKAAKKWARDHHLKLVNTFVNSASPDVVAALVDDAGFGKLGDHGGFQEKVQRIPMIVAGPGIKVKTDSAEIRLVDISVLIGKIFQLPKAPKTAE